MSPRWTCRVVGQLWAPSVLTPDWNQTQASRSSLCGKLFAISRTMACVPARATSYSGKPSRIAAATAAPPMSPIRALSVMSAISSGVLTMRWAIVAFETSTSSTPGRAAWTLARSSSGMWSSSTSMRPARTPASATTLRTALTKLSRCRAGIPQSRLPDRRLLRRPGEGSCATTRRPAPSRTCARPPTSVRKLASHHPCSTGWAEFQAATPAPATRKAAPAQAYSGRGRTPGRNRVRGASALTPPDAGSRPR
jgi:hypothetical protein